MCQMLCSEPLHLLNCKEEDKISSHSFLLLLCFLYSRFNSNIHVLILSVISALRTNIFWSLEK